MNSFGVHLLSYIVGFLSQVNCGTVKKQLNIPVLMTRNQGGNEQQKNFKPGDEDVLTTTEELSKNCMCSKIYDPVCGTDDKSYYNLCQLECENKSGRVIVKHQGNCIPF